MITTTQDISTTLDFGNCPFFAGSRKQKTKSLFCPQSYCAAVFIVSEGGTADLYPNLLGCYEYEGSLLDDMYPNYVNKNGIFLTPNAYSNPVLEYTIWLVSEDVLSTTGYIRNNKHDDQYCPYDMHDGWEYFDSQAGVWREDNTLQVLCVHPKD
eukprot:TRINITY_DN15851_c0_g2_i1.p1 TRINITY_DN15851_c0_g2~~TRINITY_DN15851_c0_g2_i1.p1  ORF type:complete len:173 (+),score=19.73 TRINITY_DN15851_c0_g2_i1:59-520(+)